MPEIFSPVPANLLMGLSASPARLGAPYATRVLSTRRANLLAYWPLWEPSGAVARDYSTYGRNGAYDGVTLNNVGIGDGKPAPSFDGTNDLVNIYSASLAAAFNKDEGTLLAWAKVNSIAEYTDAKIRGVVMLRNLDASDYVYIKKDAAANQYILEYNAGGTLSGLGVPITSIDWIFHGITWSKSADEVKIYLNGDQVNGTETGLGDWDGPLSPTRTIVGDKQTSHVDPWKGKIAHVAVWDTPLTASEIARLSEV